MAIVMPSNPAEPHTIFNDVTMGYLSKSVAGGANVTLTDVEAQQAVHEYTGTLTANIDVVIPSESKIYFAFNNTSGAFTLTVTTTGGSGTAITQGDKVILVCDGTDTVAWTAEL